MFAEVILPIPIYSSFTYEVPEEMSGEIQVGSRVLVQFGKKKYYTGIIESIHSIEPKGYEVKPVLAVLDSEPIVRYPQLNFWKWIADYYLCSPGEVYRAAIPTGLKPESETIISLNKDYEANPDNPPRMNDKQAMVMMVLEEHKKLSLTDLEKETSIKNIAKIIYPLLEEGVIEVDERVSERYRPKKMFFVSLEAERGDQQKLHDFFDKVKRSRLQERALLTFLDLSGWLSPNKELKRVTRQSLLETAGITHGILKAMEDKGVFKIEKKVINRFDSYEEGNTARELPKLSEIQTSALEKLETGFKTYPVQLLHGVTGSGKTEIYIRLIEKILKRGDQVLYLVPEISLTTQLSDRLKKVFGSSLIVYHSKFSDSERVDLWKRLLASRDPVVVLGARSSVFLPFSHLGLVIVDEEHESSFKQYDPAPRYNARDAALMLAKMHGAKSLLGSATPSIETYYKSVTGKYGLVTISERYEGSTLPEVEILDLKSLRKKKEVRGIISSPLRKRILETLQNKKQTILFQNRRGFAPVVICDQCGWTPKCLYCDVSLVYHKSLGILRCHYCGYSKSLPPLCPACGQNTLRTYGYGTQRIEEEVKEEFPEVSISRMDLDTTRNKEAYQNIIEDFANHSTDILIGTQMVSKGLDFNDVLTVGVLNADTLLNYPDFRSNERAFNMLEQVAGRAGRRKETGKVLVQTVNPDNEVLRHVVKHDYSGYYRNEIAERQKFGYPPFTKIINIYIKNKDSAMCDKGAVTFVLALRNVFSNRVLGPEKPFVSRISSYYIQSIMLKMESGVNMKKVKELLRQIYASVSSLPEIKTSQVYYDVDPV